LAKRQLCPTEQTDGRAALLRRLPIPGKAAALPYPFSSLPWLPILQPAHLRGFDWWSRRAAPTGHRSAMTPPSIMATHRLLQSVAETMADLHSGILCGRPIVHNDLKDMNVLVPAAAPEETRLIDFSHSYFAGNPPSFIMDKKQNPAGTAKYTAPEKWDGDFTQGFMADVFAFGVMAYYASTGKYPFDGTRSQIERGIMEETPSSPLKLAHNLLRNTVIVIMACLEKNPNRRPSMEQVAKVYADSASLYQ
jgi:serine/threonine protein kinase